MNFKNEIFHLKKRVYCIINIQKNFSAKFESNVFFMKRFIQTKVYRDRANTFFQGCVKGTSIAVSPNNNEIACGSYSGIVNMYDNSCLSHKQPNVTKSLKNLQTPVTSLEFNSTSEILAMASNAITNAIRLAHVPSMTVFSNFPEFAPKGIRLVRQLGFSPNSGYFHIGNSAGNALLYRLNHYKNY